MIENIISDLSIRNTFQMSDIPTKIIKLNSNIFSNFM